MGFAQAEISFRTIVLTGDEVPGAGTDTSFSNLFQPVLNDSGEVAFASNLRGPGVIADTLHGLFVNPTGVRGETLVLGREGDAVAGTTVGTQLGSFNDLILNNQGYIAAVNTVTGPPERRFDSPAIVRQAESGLSVAARRGDPISSEMPSAEFANFFRPAFSDGGDLAFFSFLDGAGVTSSNDQGVFRVPGISGEAVRPIVREGDPISGSLSGLVVEVLGSPVINGAGQVAVLGRSGGDARSASAIFTDLFSSSAQIREEYRGGDPAPFAQPGAAFLGFSSPAISDGGHLAFAARLTGADINGLSDDAVYVRSGEDLRLVARDSLDAPGLSRPARFDGFEQVLVNSPGQVAFLASFNRFSDDVSLTEDTALYLEDGNGLNLIAREGDQAPVGDTDVAFGQFGGHTLNDAGQLVFLNLLNEEGVAPNNNAAVFFTLPGASPTLLLRTGDLFDVSDEIGITDLRTISRILIATGSGGSDGRARSLSDAGDLTLALTFEDGSQGVFITRIPEPSAITLIGLGLPLILCRRR